MRLARVMDTQHRSARWVDVDPQRMVGAELRPPDAGASADGGLEGLLKVGEPARVLVKTGKEIDLSADAIEWLPPVAEPRIILCAGQNFSMHAGESEVVATPVRPSAFLRVPRTLAGHRATVPYPTSTASLDYEVEVAAVIGTAAVDVDRVNALSHVAGYCLANDLSARDIQFDEARAGSMLMGKNQPSSLPLGPWLTTRDEIDDIAAIDISLEVNGVRRQSDCLTSMGHPFDELISYWSILGFRPGDLILSGTPAGVGIFCDPPEEHLLKSGDHVVCRSSQLGELEVIIGQRSP